jgi:hypothetical protein
VGTRNLTMVQLDNEVKVAQYGQWDGYPTGNGETCVSFIKNSLSLLEDKIKFKSEIRKLRKATPDEIAILEESAENFTIIAPWLSRNICADILRLIFMGSVKYITGHSDEYSFGYNSLFCEWAYLVNMDNETLEIYRGFNKDKLNEDDRFYRDEPDRSGYYGVRLCKTYKFTDLKDYSMKELEENLYGEDDE